MKKRVLLTVLVVVLVFSFLFVGCASATYSWLYRVWKIVGWGVFLADGRAVQSDAVAELKVTKVLPSEDFEGDYGFVDAASNPVSYEIMDAKVVDGKTVRFSVNDNGTIRTFVGELVVGNTAIGTWE